MRSTLSGVAPADQFAAKFTPRLPPASAQEEHCRSELEALALPPAGGNAEQIAATGGSWERARGALAPASEVGY